MNPGIELVRLIAVILIVFTHTRNDLESGLTYFIIEKVPTFGTAILSIISGYLYYEVSRHKPGLFLKKIKSLAVPYLIANIIVLGFALMAYYFFGYNSLNRLSFNINLIKEGIFSFNSPPINPPTYFIRDIIIIFCIITLVTHKEIKALVIIVPYLLFGTLILRADIAFLFIVGILYSRFHLNFNKTTLILASIILTIFIGVCFNNYLKFPLSFLFFILLLDIRFPLINTGRFSYLLHLYHSPIIVITYPVVSLYVENPILKISMQIILALFFTYLLFLITKKYSVLKVLSGGR